MTLAFLLTTLVVVATPGTGAVYAIAAGLARGARARSTGCSPPPCAPGLSPARV